jgi:hypothetical protein
VWRWVARGSGRCWRCCSAAAGRVYWANYGGNKISYAKLDGGGGGDLTTSGATVNDPAGAAIDPVSRRMYWANLVGDRISFARLDASGGGELNTNGAAVSSPIGVASRCRERARLLGDCDGKVPYARYRDAAILLERKLAQWFASARWVFYGCVALRPNSAYVDGGEPTAAMSIASGPWSVTLVPFVKHELLPAVIVHDRAVSAPPSLMLTDQLLAAVGVASTCTYS